MSSFKHTLSQTISIYEIHKIDKNSIYFSKTMKYNIKIKQYKECEMWDDFIFQWGTATGCKKNFVRLYSHGSECRVSITECIVKKTNHFLNEILLYNKCQEVL